MQVNREVPSHVLPTSGWTTEERLGQWRPVRKFKLDGTKSNEVQIRGNGSSNPHGAATLELRVHLYPLTCGIAGKAEGLSAARTQNRCIK
jgi:hypothetical protein